MTPDWDLPERPTLREYRIVAGTDRQTRIVTGTTPDEIRASIAALQPLKISYSTTRKDDPGTFLEVPMLVPTVGRATRLVNLLVQLFAIPLLRIAVLQDAHDRLWVIPSHAPFLDCPREHAQRLLGLFEPSGFQIQQPPTTHLQGAYAANLEGAWRQLASLPRPALMDHLHSKTTLAAVQEQVFRLAEQSPATAPAPTKCPALH
jgi:hypothetical protein